MALRWSTHQILHIAASLQNQTISQDELTAISVVSETPQENTENCQIAMQFEAIRELTADQANDESGEWMMLRHERVTTFSFGAIVKRKRSTSFAS